MAKYNVLQEKSFAFAVRIVKLYKHLQNDKKEFVLSKQVLRSGTSIGANVEESIGGQSDKDFFIKIKHFLQRSPRNNLLDKIAFRNRLYH